MSELIENAAPVREKFTCDNDFKAEWVINKIRRIRQEQKRETEELERQRKFYDDQIAAIEHRADEDVAFFEDILKGYFQSRIDDGFTKKTKTKISYKLPTGELILKHQEPEYKRDDKAVIAWLEQNSGEYVKVEKKLDWAGLKKKLTVSGNGCIDASTGEVVPGIEVVEREDKFSVEVKE